MAGPQSTAAPAHKSTVRSLGLFTAAGGALAGSGGLPLAQAIGWRTAGPPPSRPPIPLEASETPCWLMDLQAVGSSTNRFGAEPWPMPAPR